MALDPITAGIDLAKTVVDKMWPDKSEQERHELAGVLAILQGQISVNQAEASSHSLFVAGWRPFIGWICGSACAWNWIGLPVAKAALAYSGTPLEVDSADLTEMLPVLMGMLGLGAFRTAEKFKGVARIR